MEQSSQQAVLRDLGALESAIAQPRQTFSGTDLYPGVAAKAAALAFSLIQNHPFVDGNKRVGHAAMVTFLRLNGRRIEATVDDAEQAILHVASGSLDRAGLQAWIEAHEIPHS
jgi:death-on-curing protein